MQVGIDVCSYVRAYTDAGTLSTHNATYRIKIRSTILLSVHYCLPIVVAARLEPAFMNS